MQSNSCSSKAPYPADRHRGSSSSNMQAIASSHSEASSGHGLRRTVSRHVKLIENSSHLRERQWTSGSHSRPPMVRSPSQYSARSAYSRHTSGGRTPIDPYSPRASMSTLHLQHLLENLEMDQYDTFGMEELRDGFFDATFYRPSQQSLAEYGEDDSDVDFSLSDWFGQFIHTQREDIKFFFTSIRGTDKGVLLVKAFTGYFISYILCLIPTTQLWLGRYSYWCAFAALFSHSGRTTGGQIEGTVACIGGGAFGLAIGGLALEVASLTAESREGYAGVLVAFYVPTLAIVSWVRCSWLRLYQPMMTAGFAIAFLCAVETDIIVRSGTWDTGIFWKFAIPWLIGVGICLVVNFLIYPETGGKALATALHDAVQSSLEALELPRLYSLDLHGNMGAQLVNLSEAVRDMRMELTFVTISPNDAEQLRNILQGVIRELMAVKPETNLFDCSAPSTVVYKRDGAESDVRPDVIVEIEPSTPPENQSMFSADEDAVELVKNTMAGPTRQLINNMINTLHSCDCTLMRIARQQQLCDANNDDDIRYIQSELRRAIQKFDDSDISLIDHPKLPRSYSTHPELVELFLFIHPARQAASQIDILASKVIELSLDPTSRRRRFFLPSYPWKKAVGRCNPQVLHDRGGSTAGHYFRIKKEIEDIIDRINERARAAEPSEPDMNPLPSMDAHPDSKRHKVWRVLHRLQQFESRFAFKVVLVMGMLSIPAWLPQSRHWWSENESWWALVAAWVMLHPRVGGNLQDLITRTAATVTGAVWGGLSSAAADAAGGGRPYVLAACAAVFMIPAIFRFTISSHPRSGFMACVSFTVVSLSAYNNHGDHSSFHVTWTRGLALVAGVVSAIFVNWIVWPFVARHELRKSLSNMLLNLGLSYRGVVARYIYHDAGYEPTEADIALSEIQEAKLREACFVMREISDLTRHEIRPRGPFNPAPYNAAIDACERFLEHIVEVRQASLYFQPFLFQHSQEATQQMMSVRRDAVASILMNMYVFAGALRSKRPVPRYLPSAAAARKRLLDKMAEVEKEFEDERILRPRPEKSRRWADVYHYAYSAALTDIVGQVEKLERLTKVVLGEMQLDAPEFMLSSTAGL